MTEFFRKNKLALVGFLIVIALTIVAILGPWIAPYDPAVQRLPDRLEGPSWNHPFGNDELGRDILSRILLGTRVSMRVGATVVLLSVIVGVLIGGFAGYIGGKLDTFVTAMVINVKTLEFVEGARALGASSPRIFVTHILPNIIQPVLIQASIGMAVAILLEASLSFLGLGIAPPTPSWGSMLNDARSHLFDAPHMVIFPSLALVMTVLSFNFLGDALRDWLDPRNLG
jgi:peptide/nickel transport system permease protein